jgi:hypothetical protein
MRQGSARDKQETMHAKRLEVQLEVLVDRQSSDCERRAGTKHNQQTV